MMKLSILSSTKIILIILMGVFTIKHTNAQNTPTIKVNSEKILLADPSVFPLWLKAGQTLEVGDYVNFLSVLQFAVEANSLLFEDVLMVTIPAETVPIGKVWKVEFAGMNESASIVGSQGPVGQEGPAGPIGQQGVGIHWLGEFAAAPDQSEINDAYYNNVEGISYLWDGNEWQIIAKDGQGSNFSPLPGDYGFSESSNGIWYKVIWSTGTNTLLGMPGYAIHAPIESALWRLAIQSEINSLRMAGVLTSGFQGWSGDGYPGQETGYQYYYLVNSGSVTWHQSDWGNNNFQKAVLVWRN